MCVHVCVYAVVCVFVLFNYLAATEITTWLARTGGRHKSGTLLNCKEGTVLYLQLHVCCCVCMLLCVCVLFNYLPATEITTRLARTGGRHNSGTLLN